MDFIKLEEFCQHYLILHNILLVITMRSRMFYILQ